MPHLIIYGDYIYRPFPITSLPELAELVHVRSRCDSLFFTRIHNLTNSTLRWYLSFQSKSFNYLFFNSLCYFYDVSVVRFRLWAPSDFPQKSPNVSIILKNKASSAKLCLSLSNLKGALQPPKVKHFASITDPKKVGPLLLAFDDYEGTPTVRAALQLAPLVFSRPGELRQMEWEEIDWELSEWRIPESKMKMGQPHIVPLSRQALAILQGQHLLTGRWQYVFPSEGLQRRAVDIL